MEFHFKIGVENLNLTNKKKLQLYNSESRKSIVVEPGSSIEYLNHEASYNEFYRTSTYRLNCMFENNPVVITCTMRKDEDKRAVSCVHGNLFKSKRYFWNEVFEENFPK